MPLKILSYDELYGWTMDAIVEQIGKKNNCTFCGVFRRQALDRGAAMLNVDHIVTGHNADDIAETVLMNSMSFDRNISFYSRLKLVFQSCEGILLVFDDAHLCAPKVRIQSNDQNPSNTHTRKRLSCKWTILVVQL